MEMSTWLQVFCLVCTLPTFVGGAEVIIRVPHVASSQEGTCEFPDVLTVEFFRPDWETEWVIQLTRDYVIPSERSVYLMTDKHPSGIEEFKVASDQHEGAQAYHSHRHGAAFLVKCARTQDGRLIFQLEGSVYLGEHKNRVAPTTTWRQEADMSASHLTAPYRLDEVKEFKAGDSAAKIPPSEDYIRDTVHRQHTHSRYKRAVTLPAVYNIDILTVVDITLYTKFLNNSNGNKTLAMSNILDYLGSLFTAISMRLDTLSLQNRTLKIRMLDPVLLTDGKQSPYNQTDLVLEKGGAYMMNATVLLDRFKNWLIKTKNLKAYDHAMFVTALDIFGGLDSGIKFNITKGLAYVGTVCSNDGYSSSVLEDKGAYQSEGVAAHEIAHGLGSLHDGQDNPCNAMDRYIMSDATYPDTAANILNPWKFSSCSSAYIMDKLIELEADAKLLQNCLINATGSVETQYRTISADEQCKLFYGNESYVCRGSSIPSLDTLCDEFFCYVPGTTNICERMTAATGTCCGNQKKCLQGQCTDAAQGECPWNDFCPLGDQEGIIIDGKTCDQLTSTYCYILDVNIKCCDTCRKFWSDRQGCTYGDKQLGCKDTNCGNAFSNGPFQGLLYDFICCSTCRQQCIDDNSNLIVAGQGYTCNDYIINRGNRYICYEKQILQGVCCKSCEDARDAANEGCSFGDRQICSSLLLKSAGFNCSDSQRGNCCYTCSVLDSRIQTPSPTPATTKSSPTPATTKSSTKATTKSSSTKATTKSSPTPTTTISSPTPATTTSSPTPATTVTTKGTSIATTRSVTTPCDKFMSKTCGGSANMISTSILCVVIVAHICLNKWLS